MCKVYQLYKVSNRLYKKGVPILPRAIFSFIRFVFGCAVPYSAEIGEGTIFGLGGIAVSLHARAVIGKNCSIGQCVVIGGRSGEYGVPVIGDNVHVGVGAKVLGPITIGDNAIIGANAVVIRDVAANTVVGGVPARVLKKRTANDALAQAG